MHYLAIKIGQKMWRSPEPREFYDVIIIGGGGHGLGTAYYLAKEHGLKNICNRKRVGLVEVTQEEIPLL